MYKERLVELREDAGIKQYELADIIDIYKGLYNQYETEYEIIPLKHLNTICDYFNVSLDYIFGLTNIKNYESTKKDIDSKVCGERIKKFRKGNKITQAKLAESLNTVQPVIVNYENGKHLIATPFLYTICKRYDVSADYLLGKIDYEPEQENK